MKKLLLLDGMAAVYRAYYALNRSPRVNSKGMNTSCVLGFTTMLYDLIRSQHPTHVGVAFDLQKPTFRHEMYAEYKANRDAMPEEIQIGLPWVKKIIGAFGIPILTCEGFEADDVIGTVSHAAEEAGFDEVLMATPDKDFAQLVTPVVRMYRFSRGKEGGVVMGVDEVKEWFGVENPRQVIDILGLWGDASDNIPGIRGVGEKTAKKLVAQFGSIEEMVARSGEIKNDKLRQQVQESADDALFSKQLATIRLDAPIVFDEQGLCLHDPDYEELRRLCDELEFRQFARKVFTDLSVSRPDLAVQWNKPRVAQTVVNQPPIQFEEAPTLFSVADATPEPPAENPLTADVLDGLRARDVALLIEGATVAMSTDADHVWTTQVGDLDLPRFRMLLADRQTTKLCFDLKTLKYLLAELDAPIEGNLFDLQLAHYLLDAEMRHTLEFVCSAMVGYEPATTVARCAAMWQLWPLMAARMKDASLLDLYQHMELPLVDVLMAMEREGVRIDVEALREYAARLSDERSRIEQKIYELAGGEFNINSSRQLGEVLYERLQVTDRPPRTATHQYSTAEDVLQKLADRHPVIPLVLEYRSLAKLVGTYLDSFPRLISPSDHRLHTVYNQTVTATGRLSSSNPNLQNIPIRTERGREIRRAFVARDDEHLLLAADYSQIELRIIASLSRDEHLLAAFNHGHDIHAATAAKIYHLPIEEVSKEQRRAAKSVNFGIVYGISAFGLSEQLGIARREAAALIDEYFAQYPSVMQFIEQSKQFAREHGYARTLLGRRRYLPDILSRNAAARSFAERNAVNMPIQGTSADMIKLAMVHIYNQLQERQLRTRMILQVHDELVFDLYRPEEAEVRALVEREMKQALPLDGLEIEVGIDVGSNWLEAH